MVQYHFGGNSFLTYFRPFSTIFDPFSQAKIPQNAAKRASGGQKPLVAVCLGQSEWWKPPKVGFARGKSVHRFAIRSVWPEMACPGHGHSGARSTLAAGTRAFRVAKAIVCRPNTIPDSVVNFFFSISGPLLLWGPEMALRG